MRTIMGISESRIEEIKSKIMDIPEPPIEIYLVPERLVKWICDLLGITLSKEVELVRFVCNNIPALN